MEEQVQVSDLGSSWSIRAMKTPSQSTRVIPHVLVGTCLDTAIS